MLKMTNYSDYCEVHCKHCGSMGIVKKERGFNDEQMDKYYNDVCPNKKFGFLKRIFNWMNYLKLNSK